MLVTELSEQEIKQLLHNASQEYLNQGPCPDADFPADMLSGQPRPAAVLIPLLVRDGSWHILYTRRTSNLAEHSGQVAFPGGRADPGDRSLEETALREAREEIGLDPRDVRILGRLREFLTITNYRVTPVVGVIPWPYPFKLSPEEVSQVFTIPLSWLADPANYEVKPRPLPSPHGSAAVIYYNAYENEILWGASARFTHELLGILGLVNRRFS